MAATARSGKDAAPEARYQARLEQELARLRAQARKEVEEFKAGFAPPSDEQIERLLYPELAEFPVEFGGRRFALRELPALAEKKFLRLVEQKLPALVGEILSFDEHLGDDPAQAFARLLTRAGTALDLVSDACVLVLDPGGQAGLTREFIQQHASTAHQLRILKAQLLLNGARDFLSQLFPALTAPEERKARSDERTQEESRATPGSPQRSVGWNSSANHPAPSPGDSPSASSPSSPGNSKSEPVPAQMNLWETAPTCAD
jgi:hypothetical protein